MKGKVIYWERCIDRETMSNKYIGASVKKLYVIQLRLTKKVHYFS